MGTGQSPFAASAGELVSAAGETILDEIYARRAGAAVGETEDERSLDWMTMQVLGRPFPSGNERPKAFQAVDGQRQQGRR